MMSSPELNASTRDVKAENPHNLPPVLLKRFGQFQKIDDNTKTFQRIIELGKKLAPLAEELKTTENQVHGCTSLTYIVGSMGETGMQYQGESNSHLVRGLLALLIEGFNEQAPEALLKIDPAFIEAMGLSRTLTASRANGFMNTFNMMQEIARKSAA